MHAHIIEFLLVALALTLPVRVANQSPTGDEWQSLDFSLRGAKSFVPKDGFVPSAGAAIKIAEAVAIAQYGEKTIRGEEPFRARLQGDVWTVMGTVHPVGAFGGTAVVKLSKQNGRILFMIHQQ
jgi:hypothetical protein